MSQNETVFSEGIIKEVHQEKLVVDTKDGIDTLIIDGKSNVWRGEDGMQLGSAKIGDHFYSRGYKNENVLTIENIWLNIVNVPAVIDAKNGMDIDVRLMQNNARWKIKLDADKTKIMNPKNLSQQLSHNELASGQNIQVIGLREPGKNQILATTVYSYI